MQYYSIQATNSKTHQTLQRQDLTGHKITDRAEALLVAESFAQQLSRRSRDSWVAKVVLVSAA
jgi:hypothetical protein